MFIRVKTLKTRGTVERSRTTIFLYCRFCRPHEHYRVICNLILTETLLNEKEEIIVSFFGGKNFLKREKRQMTMHRAPGFYNYPLPSDSKENKRY